MAQNEGDRKNTAGGLCRQVVEGCIWWLENHPRTGWYIATLATLNFFLNLIDAFDLF